MSSNACNSHAGKLSESDLLAALQSYGGEQARHVARNPKLLKSTFDLLRAVQSANALGGASAMASGFSAATRAAGAEPAVQRSARATSFVVGTFKSTMDMRRVFSLTSTGAVLVYVGATGIQKTGMAASLAGDDSEQAKCIGALMELAGSAGVAVVSAPTGILLTLTLASLTASAINASFACTSVK
ncbi:hypothetical protein [Telluria beijingensis]|uniref:hypothetical protein n=1 Tax=Telluria beijingensis TaxID=3068633 RepID=UPI00279549CE|nr:hypothetical protein [Massilia sp. REN29]